MITFCDYYAVRTCKTTFRRCFWGDNRSTRHSRVQDYIQRYALIIVAANRVIWRGHVKPEMALVPCRKVCGPVASLKSVFPNRLCFHTTSMPLSIPLGTFGQTLKTDRVGIPKPGVPEHNSVLRLPPVLTGTRRPDGKYDRHTFYQRWRKPRAAIPQNATSDPDRLAF